MKVLTKPSLKGLASFSNRLHSIINFSSSHNINQIGWSSVHISSIRWLYVWKQYRPWNLFTTRLLNVLRSYVLCHEKSRFVTCKQQWRRSAWASVVLSAPLFLESVYEKKKTEISLEFQTVWICWARSEPKLSANVISRQKKSELKGPSPYENLWIHAETTIEDPVRGIQAHWQFLCLCLTSHQQLRSYVSSDRLVTPRPTAR